MDRFVFANRDAARLRVPIRSRLAISERRLLLVTGDLALICVSILGSLRLWASWAEREVSWALWREQALWAVFIFLGWSLWLQASKLYNLQDAVRRATSVRRIAAGSVTITLAYLIMFFLTTPASSNNEPLLPRIAPALSIVNSTVLLIAWRLCYAWLLGGPTARRRVLILGAGNAGTTLCRTIQQEHSAHYRVLGFIDDDEAKYAYTVDNIHVLGNHTRLLHLAKQHQADEIALAISAEVHGSLFQSIMDCHEQGIAVTPMPLLYERLTGRIAVEHIGSQWYIALPLQQHAASKFLSGIKRFNDLVFGLAGSLACLVFLPFIAAAIRLDSPGPIFYTQERAGLHGQLIRVRKFRSMIQDAEGDGQARWATRDDQRITRVGRFLRKTRLDELPQVLNVLRGEMSLVGPRPERPQFIEQLQHQIPFYRTRLAAKPGLTGWAQINYGYGATVEDALIKLQYDLYYIKHQTPWLDFLIMLRTIGVVFQLKGQ